MMVDEAVALVDRSCGTLLRCEAQPRCQNIRRGSPTFDTGTVVIEVELPMISRLLPTVCKALFHHACISAAVNAAHLETNPVEVWGAPSFPGSYRIPLQGPKHNIMVICHAAW